MFGSSKKVVAKAESMGTNVDILLGKTSNLQGTLKASGVARMDGMFEGTVEVEGDLIVGPNAFLKAEIKADNITVAGNIQGNLLSGNKVELLVTAKVIGDITAKTIMIEEGAKFSGRAQWIEETGE